MIVAKKPRLPTPVKIASIAVVEVPRALKTAEEEEAELEGEELEGEERGRRDEEAEEEAEGEDQDRGRSRPDRRDGRGQETAVRHGVVVDPTMVDDGEFSRTGGIEWRSPSGTRGSMWSYS